MEPRPLGSQITQLVLEHLAHEPREHGRTSRTGPLTGDDVDDPPGGRRGVALKEEPYARFCLTGVHSVKIELLDG